jgi:act minimal PKS acyl carrier protein
MQRCAGSDATVNLEGDILDTRFDDLGYDSLARLETASAIEQEFGVLLDDDAALGEVATPREFLEYVNRHIPQEETA